MRENEAIIMPPPSTAAVLTEAEVIDMLALGTHKRPDLILARLTAAGRLPVLKISQRIRRYRLADVQHLIEKGTAE